MIFAGVAYIRSKPVLLGAISFDLFAVLLGGVTALLPISTALRPLVLFSHHQRIREPPWWPIIPVHQLTHLRIQQVDLFLDPETALDELLSLVKGEIPVAPHVHP